MPDRHIVRSYDQELGLLKNNILEMGKLAHAQLGRALETVISRNSSQAEAIIAADDQVDKLQQEIDRLTLNMLAKRQPMAQDLRNIVSGLKMAADLERIADYSSNIARHSLELNSADIRKPVEVIVRMAEYARTMLTEAMTAYDRADSDLAQRVWHRDEVIDRFYSDLLSDLYEFMREDAHYARPFTALLFVARCCERIGDHIQNLAEDVYFIVTGEKYYGKERSA